MGHNRQFGIALGAFNPLRKVPMNTRQHSSRTQANDAKVTAPHNPAVITGGTRSSRFTVLPGARPRVGKHPPVSSSLLGKGKEILIDPQTIRPSKWANRHAASYLQPEFLDLKRSIAAGGGNTVPVKVRPITARASGKTSKVTFELVYGHRRHKACLELGMPVRAIVQVATDEQLVAQMHAENLHRRDLSAYERGLAYEQMLAGKLFKNPAELARKLGVDAGDVSRLRFLATLPPEILEVMQSPLDLAIHDADKLRPALVEHHDEVLRRVSEIASTEGSLPAKQLLKRLSDFSAKTEIAPIVDAARSIEIEGRRLGQITLDAHGHPDVELSIPLTSQQVDALELVVRRFLCKVLGKPQAKRASGRMEMSSEVLGALPRPSGAQPV
jgi:ParB family chromosome partitioning protein